MSSHALEAEAQSTVNVVEIADPTAVGESIEFLEQDVVQTGSNCSKVKMKRVVVRFDGVLLSYQSTNVPLRARTSISADLFGYVAFGPRTRGSFNGLSIQHELLIAAEPGTTGEFVAEPGYESVALFVAPSHLREEMEMRGRSEEFRSPKKVEMLQAKPSAVQAIFSFGKKLAITSAQNRTLFDEHTTSRYAARLELIEVLLAALGTSKPMQPSRKQLTEQEHGRIVRTAEDYVASNPDQHVSVSQLCVASVVSERTLQYAFSKVMHTTPISYLTKLRLHRVRKALRDSTGNATTVSVEAYRWGFWHLGEFSKSYKKLFSELPSETLKRGR